MPTVTTRALFWQAILAGVQDAMGEVNGEPTEPVQQAAATVLTYVEHLIPHGAAAGDVEALVLALVPPGPTEEVIRASIHSSLGHALGAGDFGRAKANEAAAAAAMAVRAVADQQARSHPHLVPNSD